MIDPARLRRLARRLAALAVTGALVTGPVAGAPLITALVLVGVAALGVTRLAAAIGRARLARRSRAEPGAILLGRDLDGRPVALGDRQLAAHALLVGASGSGKSTTMLTVLDDRIARGHPVVVIDMKGSPGFAESLAASTARAGRTLRIWTPEGPSVWNPLAHGTATQLKDKLISAERFSEPHYQRAAERYLQTALRVLHATGPPEAVTLGGVVALMEPATLAARARGAPPALAQETFAYLEGLTPDQLSAARGVGTRLALLHESDAGRWLGAGPGPRLDLGDALRGGDVVLLSINSSLYGTLGGQLGALAIQDLTTAAGGRLAGGPPGGPAAARPAATVAIDEFSALGADNVLSLLARGREAGVGVLLATQELSDLERAGRGFRDQVLGITAVTLAHRQEVHESALAISRMAGTRTVWRETENLPAGLLGAGRGRPASRGSRRRQEEPVVHPNTIKRLGVGQAVLLTNVPEPIATPVAVRPPAPGPPAPRRRGRRRRRGRGIDPPGAGQEPGVTR